MAIHQVDRTIISPRRPLTVLFRGVFAFALLAASLIVTAAPALAAHTIAPTTTCNNGVGGGGGQGVICEVTIVNTITGSGGSAVVTVHECLGSAGSPSDGSCSTQTLHVAGPVTLVNQCNGTVEGNGSKLLCSVHVTNNFYGVSPGATAATVDQCIGSGAGGGTTMICTPLGSTTSAVITQCNGTANGGGSSVTCTATGTKAAALGVTINQCNDSANGGGGLVVCSASLINNARSGTPPPTGTFSAGSSSSSTPSPLALLVWLAMGGLGLAVVEARRRSILR